MSHHDYTVSRNLANDCDASFASLVMAAMRKADTLNLSRLQEGFPEIWAELQERYNSPGGWLPDEREDD